MWRATVVLVLAVASCGGVPTTVTVTTAATASASSEPSAVARVSLPPAVPTPSLPPGACTRAGMTNAELIRRWLDLAGRRDPAAARDCFAASYGVPDTIVDRWANLGAPTSSTTMHADGDMVNGCDRFTVTADFPYGNPYAPVQDANKMFFVVGVGLDGDQPRIFGTATGAVQRSPDVSPRAGPPDCR